MDSETYQKIVKYHGWDYCEHGYVRRRCEDCKWDVPALWRLPKKRESAKVKDENHD